MSVDEKYIKVNKSETQKPENELGNSNMYFRMINNIYEVKPSK